MRTIQPAFADVLELRSFLWIAAGKVKLQSRSKIQTAAGLFHHLRVSGALERLAVSAPNLRLAKRAANQQPWALVSLPIKKHHCKHLQGWQLPLFTNGAYTRRRPRATARHGCFSRFPVKCVSIGPQVMRPRRPQPLDHLAWQKRTLGGRKCTLLRGMSPCLDRRGNRWPFDLPRCISRPTGLAYGTLSK
jgi:hypothetical protein